MTTQQIADRLVELMRAGKFETAQRELYSEKAISIEPHATPAFPKETKSLNAIIQKVKNGFPCRKNFMGLPYLNPWLQAIRLL